MNAPHWLSNCCSVLYVHRVQLPSHLRFLAHSICLGIQYWKISSVFRFYFTALEIKYWNMHYTGCAQDSIFIVFVRKEYLFLNAFRGSQVTFLFLCNRKSLHISCSFETLYAILLSSWIPSLPFHQYIVCFFDCTFSLYLISPFYGLSPKVIPSSCWFLRRNFS